MKNSVLMRVVLPIGVVVIAVALFIVLLKMRPQVARETPAAPRPVVAVHHVSADDAPIRVRSFGTVEASRTISVVAQVGGEIADTSPSFEAGAWCRADQVLLRIDETDYRMALEKARVDVAQAEFNLARAEEEATLALAEWDALATEAAPDGARHREPTPLARHEPQLKLARASLEAARAAQEQAAVNLKRCTVTAPFDGRILTANVDQGQVVGVGTVLGSLYGTEMAEITVQIPDEDLAWVQLKGPGVAANDTPAVAVSADFAGTTSVWIGRAVRLGGAVDRRSRQASVVVEVSDPFRTVDGRPALMDGMFVEVTFSCPAPAGAVVVPRAALRPGNQVWLVDDKDVISIRDVTVARADVDEVVITDGLAPGDRLCVSNLQYVTEGMSVQVEGATAGDEK